MRWPDARGWIGLGVFALSFTLIFLMTIRELRQDEFFQTIATVIISNGLMAVVAWAYAATKNGHELAQKNAAIVQESATASVSAATTLAANASANPKDPISVVVENTEDNPAIVSELHQPVDESPLQSKEN